MEIDILGLDPLPTVVGGPEFLSVSDLQKRLREITIYLNVYSEVDKHPC